MSQQARVASSHEEPELAVPTVAVVIPAFRVANHIAAVVAGLPDFVSHVVVVDDASPDRTSEVVRALGDPRVRLICHQRNAGVGGAMVTGYQEAERCGADVIVKMDGDGQMDPAYLPALIEPILSGEADYTKGSRFFHTRKLRQMPLSRRVGNLGLSFLAKAASGYWEVFDPTNGFTAIHRDVMRLLDWEKIDPRWFFETSMLIELNLLRAVVRDVEIPARYADERSSLSETRALISFPPRLLAALLRRLWMQYFVRDFSPASLFVIAGSLLSAFGVLWGAWHWWRSYATQVPATTGTVMIAVVPLILGIQVLLQAISSDIQSSPREPLSRSAWRRRKVMALLTPSPGP